MACWLQNSCFHHCALWSALAELQACLNFVQILDFLVLLLLHKCFLKEFYVFQHMFFMQPFLSSNICFAC